jgi:hypothetical protein
VALLCPASAAEQKRCHNTRGASPSSGAAPSDVPERASSGAASAAPSLTVTVESTQVWFSPLTSDEIAWYVRSGEPMDKAGAYAIQGLASRFVERIDGSYPNVVGLPVALVYRLLQNVPEIRQFWAP